MRVAAARAAHQGCASRASIADDANDDEALSRGASVAIGRQR
jgi:hypothetical protein